MFINQEKSKTLINMPSSMAPRMKYGALDLGPLPPPPRPAKKATLLIPEEVIRKENRAYDRWAAEKGLAQAPFVYGAPPGFPASVDRLKPGPRGL